ncbi:hypothetical protein C8F04DRAFT_1137731 [Mycena alexandri]|uniref:DUF6534 domain-containing protein n=1 Tax=Mycena alexandri TaxID=1745969 RepID=A0AAD6SA92_9AGAR|nr:hypothetical protein C8F04DRAFT_1137731 [Mycena alexandri]
MATLDNTIGLLFQAVVISAALYGAGCLQAWFYFRTYLRRDSVRIKSLVTFVIVCDTCQQAILTACAYSYLITNFANRAILNHVFSTLIIEIYFSNFIALAVQLFYCYRVYRVSNGSWLASIFLALLGVGSFVALFVYTTQALKISTFTELATLKTLSMSCNIAAAVTDALISAFLVYYLYISKTGFEKTDDLINRLIAFAFNTGLPTSICALLACISINVWPDTFIYIFWFLLQGRFYTNTLLVSLNTRDYLRSITAPGTFQEFPLSGQPSAHLSHREAIAIRIDTTCASRRDFDLKMQHPSENDSTRE